MWFRHAVQSVHAGRLQQAEHEHGHARDDGTGTKSEDIIKFKQLDKVRPFLKKLSRGIRVVMIKYFKTDMILEQKLI